jgi:hypothetical protein
LAGGGGFSPDCLTDFDSVTTVLPPGLVAVVCDFVLLSSEQPENPIPKPAIRTPIIAALISFRMEIASALGNAAVSDLA